MSATFDVARQAMSWWLSENVWAVSKQQKSGEWGYVLSTHTPPPCYDVSTP